MISLVMGRYQSITDSINANKPLCSGNRERIDKIMKYKRED